MDGWSDEGCRKVGSQKLEDQGQGQRCLEAITLVGQDPAWVVEPGWMDGWKIIELFSVVFCVVRAVHKLDVVFVTNKIPNKERPVEKT
jgi:hypothetical protein